MASGRKPTIRAVWLGQELRKMRDEAGLTVRAMGSLVHLNQANVSKLENGIYPASVQHVEAYLRICGIDDPKRRSDVFKICDDVLRKGWWDGFAGELASELMDRIWLESKAVHIDAFEPILVPGLLQTSAYARAVMAADQPDASSERLERWHDVRTTRQLIITKHEPITLRAIIDQSVIRRAISDSEAGLPQLRFLAEVSERPNIELRVLPDSAGFHAGMNGSFEVLSLADPYPEAGLLTTPSGEVCVEGDAIHHLKQKYELLLQSSLDPEPSRKLIKSEVDKQ
ncbi:helix-turn-helix domain-containing protein [Stackebrandtia nassauensis]|uniref:Helix-turn-helix domain protein n=1 Tax=Stackebrandtia nassauensis (strain DSM 44728 / CIP 108903 / NRRL B-16338 / NBRC 102104 / LLR-40K-21) TaxID=446470 RepID=D3Q512_STANL|nr:helix-turn-helix transcriptional regulator [Stackebrandtia nassauensis]ADD44061.1 helix-turn-helix domain protein [Stackebrandtia nassauensis DSM 44728]